MGYEPLAFVIAAVVMLFVITSVISIIAEVIRFVSGR